MVGVLAGALETKVRPAVVISSSTYLVERPDVLVGILTTKAPKTTTSTDCVLMDWQLAGLRAESYFRAYVLTAHRSELTVIGHLSDRDWNQVTECGSPSRFEEELAARIVETSHRVFCPAVPRRKPSPPNAGHRSCRQLPRLGDKPSKRIDRIARVQTVWQQTPVIPL